MFKLRKQTDESTQLEANRKSLKDWALHKNAVVMLLVFKLHFLGFCLVFFFLFVWVWFFLPLAFKNTV